MRRSNKIKIKLGILDITPREAAPRRMSKEKGIFRGGGWNCAHSKFAWPDRNILHSKRDVELGSFEMRQVNFVLVHQSLPNRKKMTNPGPLTTKSDLLILTFLKLTVGAFSDNFELSGYFCAYQHPCRYWFGVMAGVLLKQLDSSGNDVPVGGIERRHRDRKRSIIIHRRSSHSEWCGVARGLQ